MSNFIETMYYNQNLKIFYNPFRVIVNFLIAFLFVVFTIIVCFSNTQPWGIILGLIIWISLGEFIYNAFRNCIRFTQKLPALELNEIYFLDFMINKKITWDSIEKTGLVTRRGITFLVFDLKDNGTYFRQYENPVLRFFYLTFKDVIPIQSNMTYTKGKDEENYKMINEYYKSKSYS